MLDDGSGEIAHDDFIEACMHMTGSARAIDSVIRMSGQRRMLLQIEAIELDIAVVCNTVGALRTEPEVDPVLR